jgi:hypothetical protein
MADFISMFYAKLFLRSKISVFAPNDDYHFLAAMGWYKKKDSKIAPAVIASITRYLSYGKNTI